MHDNYIFVEVNGSIDDDNGQWIQYNGITISHIVLYGPAAFKTITFSNDNDEWWDWKRITNLAIFLSNYYQLCLCYGPIFRRMGFKEVL